MCDYRNMHVVRCAITQELLQPDLSLRRLHDVDATDYFRNSFQLIVDDHSQLVGNKSIPSPDHEITGFALEPLCLFSLELVLKHDGLIVRAQPNGCLIQITSVPAGARIDHAQWSARRVSKALA